MQDRAKGTANKVIGEAKQRAGKATGDRELENEGGDQKGKGIVQDAAGKVKNTAKSLKDKVAK